MCTQVWHTEAIVYPIEIAEIIMLTIFLALFYVSYTNIEFFFISRWILFVHISAM